MQYSDMSKSTTWCQKTSAYIASCIPNYKNFTSLSRNLTLPVSSSPLRDTRAMKSDETLFNDLMRLCLGSFQTNLPDRVFRYTHMNSREMALHSANKGKKVILKGVSCPPLLSTSRTLEALSSKSIWSKVEEMEHSLSGRFRNSRKRRKCCCVLTPHTSWGSAGKYILLDYYDYYQYDN